jgi:hypothetical protein
MYSGRDIIALPGVSGGPFEAGKPCARRAAGRGAGGRTPDAGKRLCDREVRALLVVALRLLETSHPGR